MFITFEGTEGSGKTSQMACLAEFLSESGYDVLATREPGGTPIGDQIRAILLDLENKAMHPRTEILLFQASRAQLVEQVIRPHMDRGGVVLCDRYADSTIAYQGYAYNLQLDQVQSIVQFATGGLPPDLTILLDLEVEEGLKRRAGEGSWNRLDDYDLEFYRRVRMGYHQLAKSDPYRWVIIDAARPFEEVRKFVQEAVLKRLMQNNLQT